MSSLLSFFSGAVNLAVVVAAFSLIIIIHELGHFLAARWARIRVLAFAVGFGPAIVSYRPGLGWRRGSSEREYEQLRRDALGFAGERREAARAALSGRVSPTEYRLNALPFGGYVRMLGQDDADPGAVSEAPDSYQRCKPWKRMVVISAGVIANMVTAVALFIVVFQLGLAVEPAKIGAVEAGSPAASAVAENARAAGVTEPGLKPGDKILSIGGARLDSFNDLVVASAMSRAGEPLSLAVQRPGVSQALNFSITPRVDQSSRLLAMGVAPGFSTLIDDRQLPEVRRSLPPEVAEALGPGMRLAAINGREVDGPYQLEEAARTSGGAPMALTFADESGATRTVSVRPEPALPSEVFKIQDRLVQGDHLLGLMPVLGVQSVVPKSGGAKAGLREGDVFVQLGGIEWPSAPAGVVEIRRNKGKNIRVVVLRRDQSAPDSGWTEIDLGQVPVSSEGLIGFSLRHTYDLGPWVSRFPTELADKAKPSPSGAALGIPGGSRLISVNGRAVSTLLQAREALEAAAAQAAPTPGAPLAVEIEYEPPTAIRAQAPSTEQVTWTIAPDEIASVRTLTYTSPIPIHLFKPEQTLLKADSIGGAVAMGFKETRRVMVMTYLTFARLFQGTVKVEHLKGPVGIAHVGVVLLDKGWVWLMFFMALISVNLAVINFLPMPIADGGHMVYLIYEQLTGRPPPVAFQNAAAVAGLVLLGGVFLLVTYHDVGNVVRSLFGG